jgi:uncharacterized protein (TIGR03437 family)
MRQELWLATALVSLPLFGSTLIETVVAGRNGVRFAPLSVAVDGSGRLYFSDGFSNQVFRWSPVDGLRVIAGGGSTVGGKAPIPATEAKLLLCSITGNQDLANARCGGIAVDPAGRVYIAETLGHRIRMVDLDGRIRTIAGNGEDHETREGLAFEQAFPFPSLVAVDAYGFVFALSRHDGHIWLIDREPKIQKAFRTVSFPEPVGLVMTSRRSLYIADRFHRRLYAASPSVVEPQPLSGILNGLPWGLADDGRGGLLITDPERNCLYRLTPTGPLEAVAGCQLPGWMSFWDSYESSAGYSGDGGPPLQAYLNLPLSVAADAQGNIYIADSGNGVIRRIRDVAPDERPWFSTRSVMEATSFQMNALGGGIAALFGMNLTRVEGITRVHGEKLPTTLAGVKVRVDGNPAPLLEVKNVGGLQRILFHAPWPYPTDFCIVLGECWHQPATVAVEREGVESVNVEVFLDEYAPVVPRFYNGVWLAFHNDTDIPVYMGNPAKPGEWIRAYAAGLGKLRGPFELGEVAPPEGMPVADRWEIQIGGHKAEVKYIGLAPGTIGLYELRFRIPEGLGPGSYPVLFVNLSGAMGEDVWIDVGAR